MLDNVLSTWSLSHQEEGLGTEPSTQGPGVGDSEQWPPLGEEPGGGNMALICMQLGRQFFLQSPQISSVGCES